MGDVLDGVVVHSATDAWDVGRDERAYISRRHTRSSGTRVGMAVPERVWSIDTRHLGWQEDALCVGTDPEAFFPKGAVDPATTKLCNRCPVQSTCLLYALDHPTLKGIWGGTTEAERERLRLRA